MSDTAQALGLWGVPVAMLGGMIRASTPYLFVSLGETLTEKSGRVNLGLEGTLLMGAVSAYGAAYSTGSAWLGVLAAAGCGVVLGALHALLCARPRVNHIAVGIALTFVATPTCDHIAASAWQMRSSFTYRLLGQSSVTSNPFG